MARGLIKAECIFYKYEELEVQEIKEKYKEFYEKIELLIYSQLREINLDREDNRFVSRRCDSVTPRL